MLFAFLYVFFFLRGGVFEDLVGPAMWVGPNARISMECCGLRLLHNGLSNLAIIQEVSEVVEVICEHWCACSLVDGAISV